MVNFFMSQLSWIPNSLSYSRALVAIIIVLFGVDLNEYTVLSLVFFAVITDIFDGFLARLLHCQTEFGAMLDPLCDGVFVMGVLCFILRKEGVSMVYFWIILIRYAVISSYHYDLLSKGQKHLCSLWSGKWSSGLMMTCFVCYFLKMSGLGFQSLDFIFPCVIAITIVMLLISWFYYYKRYLHLSSILDASKQN